MTDRHTDLFTENMNVNMSKFGIIFGEIHLKEKLKILVLNKIVFSYVEHVQHHDPHLRTVIPHLYISLCVCVCVCTLTHANINTTHISCTFTQTHSFKA